MPPWEHTEEVLSVLKTAFPLLALSMETMVDQIHKLRRWRDKFEEKLDRRPLHQSLETHYSQHLSEFRFQKFDEVEVPGQYLQLRDKNQDFVRIERFLPDVGLVRGIGGCHRRLK